MGTRVRHKKERKTDKGTRGEGRKRFFGNSIKYFERASKRCESLIIMFLFFFFPLSLRGVKNIRLAPTWLDDSVGRALHQYHKGHGLDKPIGDTSKITTLINIRYS